MYTLASHKIKYGVAQGSVLVLELTNLILRVQVTGHDNSNVSFYAENEQ